MFKHDQRINCTPIVYPLDGDSLSSFLARLQPEIEMLARNLYYRVKMSIALEDVIQEGMIGAWRAAQRYDPTKVVDERSFVGYCIKRARGAMCDYLTKLNRTPAASLDEHLEVDTADGSMRREIADTPVPYHQASLAQRRRILAALRQLSTNERLVIMAHFRIDDAKSGHSSLPMDLRAQMNMSEAVYYKIRARALRKLAVIL